MTDKQAELLRRMFAHVANPPAITIDRDGDMTFDEPIIMIDGGHWWIRNEKVDGPPSILGTKQVDGFVLEIATYRAATRWEPEEHDYAEVASSHNFVDLAKRAVQEYVGYHINAMLDEDSWAAYAAELEQEKQELAQAEQEGYNAYPASAEDANPYPYIMHGHWHAWKKGWNAADYDQMRKEHAAIVKQNTGQDIN